MNDTPRSPRISHISWGRMVVEEVGEGKDFKLYPGGGREWDWRETGTQHDPGIQPADIAEELGALAYVEECGGDWVQALQYAQRQAKRAVIQRFVRWVHVGLDDQGEAQVELVLAVPIDVELPANWPAQFRYSTD